MECFLLPRTYFHRICNWNQSTSAVRESFVDAITPFYSRNGSDIDGESAVCTWRVKRSLRGQWEQSRWKFAEWTIWQERECAKALQMNNYFGGTWDQDGPCSRNVRGLPSSGSWLLLEPSLYWLCDFMALGRTPIIKNKFAKTFVSQFQRIGNIISKKLWDINLLQPTYLQVDFTMCWVPCWADSSTQDRQSLWLHGNNNLVPRRDPATVPPGKRNYFPVLLFYCCRSNLLYIQKCNTLQMYCLTVL